LQADGSGLGGPTSPLCWAPWTGRRHSLGRRLREDRRVRRGGQL